MSKRMLLLTASAGLVFGACTQATPASDCGTLGGGGLVGPGAPLGKCDGGMIAPDAGMDAGLDAGLDAGIDAGIDAGSDAGIDAGSDAGADAGIDGGVGDGGHEDAGLDGGHGDAGTDGGLGDGGGCSSDNECPTGEICQGARCQPGCRGPQGCPAGSVCSITGQCVSECATDAGQTACGTDGGSPYCSALQTDPSNCGACGDACPLGQGCFSGACSCPVGEPNLCGTAPNTFCTDTQTNSLDCGACGNVCPAGQVCNGVGSCAETCANDAGFSACSPDGGLAYCASLSKDPNNCGSCGDVCPTGQGCASGVCACPVSTPELCGAAPNTFCTNTASDSANCGSCGHLCAAGQICNGSGVCTETCAADAGFSTCQPDGGSPYCANLSQDSNNCGSCGTVCPTAQSCSSSACACPVADPVLCGTAPNTFCANTNTDSTNCGSCGHVCPAGQVCNGSGACTESCAGDAGYTACQPDGGAAYCANLTQDTSNCGSCGTICPTGESCASSLCSCPGATPELCGTAPNTFCTNTQTDPADCGGCGTACAVGQSCASGACSCPGATPELCGTAPNTFCTNTQTDPANCGACGKACATGEGCVTGACSCPGSTPNLCGTAPNTFCTNTQTDPANCGACGKACATGESCVTGTCSCPGTTPDLCGTAPNTFCTNTQTDPANCGVCGTVCSTGEGCATGLCGCPTSTPNLCGTAPNTFCTDIETDSNNCGACGNVCPAGQGCNGVGVCTETCATSAGFTPCTTGGGTQYCANLTQDPNNCGACGNVCATGQSCVTSKCTCPANDPSLCGTSPNQFCTNENDDPANCGACGTICPTGGGCLSGACACPLASPDVCVTAPNAICTNTQTDDKNCGSCGTVCAAGKSCVAGACASFGTGVNGNLTVTAPTVLQTPDSAVTGTSGTSTATVTTPAGFVAGQAVLLQQTQGTGAGAWETNVISSVGVGGVLTLANPLANTYLSNGGATNNHAQAVVIPQYQNVTVTAGGVLTPNPWNGTTGGILAFMANGTVSVAGTISAIGMGFRGTAPAGCGAAERCTVGFQGESELGPGAALVTANGAGGGGGQQGQDCGLGGGGAYAGAGTQGGSWTLCGVCCPTPHVGGAGGLADGQADLLLSAFFGGAGGEGGGDEDGAFPGAGGSGGGFIALFVNTLTVTGGIQADGTAGLNGNSTACGSGGCGMGAGGGGAGGAIQIISNSASLGSNLVTSNGAGGGLCTCADPNTGGPGSVGRIAVGATVVTGTTLPQFDAD